MEYVSKEFYNIVSNLFEDSNIKINKIIIRNNIYYNSMELISYLGYSDNKNSTKILSKINDHHKIRLEELYDKFPIKEEDPNSIYVNSLTEKKRRTIFITEAGAQMLAFGSTKSKAKEFKLFLVDKLFPVLRSYGYKQLLKEKEKVSTLEQNILDIKNQNNKLLELAEKQGIKLDNISQELTETKECLSDTSFNLEKLNNIVITEILPDRNLNPDNVKLRHSIVLYKNINNEYVFIRGQQSYKEKMLKYIPRENILIDNNYPNPIDLISKLKEKSDILNQEVKEKLIRYMNSKDVYSYMTKEELRYNNLRLYESNKKFMIINNKLELNSTTIEEFMGFYNDIINEKESIPN